MSARHARRTAVHGRPLEEEHPYARPGVRPDLAALASPTAELLGTPAEHKSLKTLDGGHVPQDIRGLIKEVLDWFDRYLR